jgi:hypothetical protein
MKGENASMAKVMESFPGCLRTFGGLSAAEKRLLEGDQQRLEKQVRAELLGLIEAEFPGEDLNELVRGLEDQVNAVTRDVTEHYRDIARHNVRVLERLESGLADEGQTDAPEGAHYDGRPLTG